MSRREAGIRLATGPVLRWRRRRMAEVRTGRWRWSDGGMSTAEYAIGTIAAAALAAILYTVITGDSVVSALTALVQRALSVTF
jgi:uncharacterized protein DUF4244